MLLPPVHRIRDYIPCCLSENVLLRGASHLLVHGLGADYLDNAMIKKWHTSLDRVSHLHTVAEDGQDVTGQDGFRPQVEGLMQGIASYQLSTDICIVEKGLKTLVIPKLGKKSFGKHMPRLPGTRRKGFNPGRNESEQVTYTRQW